MPDQVNPIELLSGEDLSYLASILERMNAQEPADTSFSDEANYLVYTLVGETLEGNPDAIIELIAQHEAVVHTHITHPLFARVLNCALKLGCDLGHAGCIAYQGYRHKRGFGVLKDLKAAGAFFEEAAELGSAQAMVELGALYESGNGRSIDYQKAYKLFSQAALISGHPEAMWRLGTMYLAGEFVASDKAAAFKLFANAVEAAADNVALRAQPAQHMAELLLEGVEGVTAPDPMSALLLFVQAELGYYLLIDSGETEWQMSLDQCIAGQARARDAIHELRETNAAEGLDDSTRNLIAERISHFMDDEFASSPVLGADAPLPSGWAKTKPRHFRS